jgi:hypothetical protein
MNNLQLLTNTLPQELKVNLTNELKTKAWEKAQRTRNNTACYRSYLNILARETFISWVNLMLEREISDTKKLEDNLSIWEFLNGNVINIDSTPIVLIPQETEDKSEISIPQEWLTIPDWVGNYYVAVQVNIEENWLNFWGYTTYEDLQIYGELDNLTRSVNLSGEYLETDLSLILLDYEYGWESAPQINPLPMLSPRVKTNLTQQVETSLAPRLLLNFQQWISLISNTETRYSLYQSRQPVNLTQWLTNQLESTLTKGWEILTNLPDFVPNLGLTPQLALRSLTVSQCWEILQNSNDESELNNAIVMLGNLPVNSELREDAISFLSNIIQTTEDEEIRWNAALSLRLLAPDNKLGGIWGGKTVNFGVELASNELALVIGILPKSDIQTSIFLRVYPLANNNYLPENLHLQIIDSTGEVFQEIVSRYEDSIIQYKFWANSGEKFTVKLGLNDTWITEHFTM